MGVTDRELQLATASLGETTCTNRVLREWRRGGGSFMDGGFEVNPVVWFWRRARPFPPDFRVAETGETRAEQVASVSNQKIASLLIANCRFSATGARASRQIWKLFKGCVCVEHWDPIDVEF